MKEQVNSQIFEITSEMGIHMRPAGSIVSLMEATTVEDFRLRVLGADNIHKITGIMSILMVASELTCGTHIEISANGCSGETFIKSLKQNASDILKPIDKP